MPIITLIIKAISVVLRAIALLLGRKAETQEPNIFVEKPTVLDALNRFRSQELPTIFEALDADGQEKLAIDALEYEDESLVMGLIPKIKTPENAYRVVQRAQTVFWEQEKLEPLANLIKLAYPLLPDLTYATTPSAGYRDLSLLAVDNLKPNVAWGLLVKSEKVLPKFKQLDQDVSREHLMEAKLSVLRSISNPQHGKKLLQEIRNHLEGIDSHNIKNRAKLILLKTLLAVYRQFDDEQAWEEAQELGQTPFQVYSHDPRPLALLVQNAPNEQLINKYFEPLAQTLQDLGDEPFGWLSFEYFKEVAKAYTKADKLAVYFAWIRSLPEAFAKLLLREEHQYIDDPYSQIYPYLQLAEHCLDYDKVAEARVFLAGVLGFIPKMGDTHIYRVKTNESYLQLLQKLYQKEQKTDLLEQAAAIYAHFYDPIQPSLLVNMAKTYYQLGLNEKGDQSLKDMLVHLANAPAKTVKIGGRVFKPLFKSIDSERSGQLLCSVLSELIALESDSFRQAMILVEFLRGAKEEDFAFGPASAERLIEGLDQYGYLMARSIGRAAVVEHIALIPEARTQVLRQAWELIKAQDFDQAFRDQIFWSLPTISQHQPELAHEIYSYVQPKIQALSSSTAIEDWNNSILWAISQAPMKDWGYDFVKGIGEGANEKVQ
ncbi:MAG: hypothetical protein AAF927_23460, partial [Bacteroidota bacterium]